MRRLILVIAATLVVASPALPAAAMTVAEAYAAIPHKRTEFAARRSTLPAADARALERLFRLTDQGVVLRVRGLQALRAGDVAGLQRIMAQYDELLAALRGAAMTAPTEAVRASVVQAVDDQRRLYAGKLASGAAGRRDARLTQEAHQGSAKLHQAYSMLMSAYPHEEAANKTAFFDHLCALDFL